MTVTQRRIHTIDSVIAEVNALAPTIATRAGEIEAARRLPRDLLDRLVEAGCFRMTVPASHGGLNADLASAMQLFETLARADGSTGWTVTLGATAWCDMAGLPRPSFDELFSNGPDLILAGVFNPTGTVERADDESYRVSGRWGFASGCEHAHALWVNCIEGFEGGVPQMRIAVLRRDQVVIEDTWDVSGLRGTGSHHIRVDGVRVDATWTVPTLSEDRCIDEPIVFVPPPTQYALMMAAVALGIASGAVDDITVLARDKVPLLSQSALRAQPMFHVGLATDVTTLRAARALLYETAEDIWSTALARGELTLDQRARARAASVWVTDRATAVTSSAYRSGGGSSLYSDNPLQRRLRDIYALTQHFLVRRDALVTAGAIYAGEDVEVVVY